jgi:RimJ/RimL family protein N-acetyltransferase
MAHWVVETARTGMRELTAEDCESVAMLDWLDADRVLRRCMEQYRTRGHGLWALELKSDGAFVGLCGLIAQEIEGVDELEVAYHVLPDYRGRGLASEAARGVMGYAYGTLGVGRIVSIIEPDNGASIAVALGNGLTFERPARFRGVDVAIYVARRPRPAAPGERVT